MRVATVRAVVWGIVVWAVCAATVVAQATPDDNPFKEVEPVAANRTTILPASFAGARMKVELPGIMSEIVAGGNGRYLFMHLKQLRQLAVLDVSKAALVKLIPLGSDNVTFAAGADKLFVVLRDTQVIQRYGLASFERELAVRVPTTGPIRGALMGSGSLGPLMLVIDRSHQMTVEVMDAVTMALHDMKRSEGIPTISTTSHPCLRASADGSVFVVDSCVMSLSDTMISTPRNRVGNSYCLLPNSDGSVLYSPQGIYTSDLTATGQAQPTGFAVPAVQPGYYITLPIRYPQISRVDRPGGVSVHVERDARPLVTLDEVDVSLSMPQDGSYRPGLFLDQRFWYIPDAKLLVQVPATNDHLLLHKIDVEQPLEKSPINYLFVTSRAPLTAVPGKLFEYQITVRSKNGGVKYRLESAPGDMQIDANGKIAWLVPAYFSEERQRIVVAVTDRSAQEILHSFAVRLPRAADIAKAQAASAAREREAAIAKARDEQELAMAAKLPELGLSAKANAEKNANAMLLQYKQRQKTQKQPYPLRNWTDSDGNQIEAHLTEIFAGFANLRSARGQMYLAPISRLSVEDQAHLAEISAAAIAERKKADAERSHPTASHVQLQLLGIGLVNATRQRRELPAAYSTDPDGKPLLSWRVHLLPHLGASELFKLFKLDQPWDSDYNRKLLAYMPSFYRATGSTTADNKTNFLAVIGERSVIMPPQIPEADANSTPLTRSLGLNDGRSGVTIASIRDGTSNTAVVVEVPDKLAIEWTRPDDLEYEGDKSIGQLWGFRAGGLYSVFADGKVRFISEQSTLEMIGRLFDRADGLPVELK